MEALILGFKGIMNFATLFYMLVGTIVGIVAGAIPGFTVVMALIIMLPFTFVMCPVDGIATLVAACVGGLSGGLITAILIGIPGTPSAVATMFDGYPMAQKGKGAEALGIGIYASFFGTIISTLILILLAPQVIGLALKFGPWEYFSLAAFSLTIIASLTGDSLVKGLMAGMFGLLISTIGMDLISGHVRLTFGLYLLRAGMPFLVVLIGLFAFSRLLSECEQSNFTCGEGAAGADVNSIRVKPLDTLIATLKQPINLIRSSFIGTLIGALPGPGASISNILAYDQAKKWSKTPELFGTGHAEGVVATEAGNNSAMGGAIIPLIAFGLPGDSLTAILLGALMIHGVKPGPLLMQTKPELVGGIFAALFVGSILMLLVQMFGIKLLVKIAVIPKYLLIPSVLSLCVVGSFVLNNRLSDVYVLALMGVVGYVLIKTKIPLPPIILGAIIGPMAEINLRRAIMTDPSWSLFVTRPISVTFLALGLLSVAICLWQRSKSKKRESAAA